MNRLEATAEAEDVASLETALAAALQTGAWRVAIRMVAAEFRSVGIRSAGAVDMDRSAWLKAIRSLTVHELKLEPPQVEVYGDTAIALVEGYWRAELEGRPLDERYLLTDVWLRRDGGWKLVRRHAHPI
ncbi:MAG: nuclear transport factor 2 family protein [Phenylobacterium sp.]